VPHPLNASKNSFAIFLQRKSSCGFGGGGGGTSPPPPSFPFPLPLARKNITAPNPNAPNTINKFLETLLDGGKIVNSIFDKNDGTIDITWESNNTNEDILSLIGKDANNFIKDKLSYHINKYDEFNECDSLTGIYTDQILMKNLK
jgi:hypothetical protein